MHHGIKINIPFAFFVFILILKSSYVEAQEYDDPAVAVCEVVLKQELPLEANYSRILSHIDGSVVSITFELSILNTRPFRKTQRCEFELSDGEFKLARHKPLKPNCSAEIAAFEAVSRAAKGVAHYEEVRSALVQCNEQLKRDLATMIDEMAYREMPLTLTGIYPIPEERTSLVSTRP